LSKNAILLDGGEDALIERTIVTNSGGNATGYPGSTFSAITFSENAGENVGGVVRDCYLPKASNTASIRYPDTLTISEIKLYDNRTPGYATDLGLDAALANTATLLAEYDGQNNHNTQGTSILSTGETGGTKFLREDGDGTSSWQTPSLSAATGYDLATDWAAGDGVTDDTDELRTAIGNSANALYIPAGTYLTSGPLVIPPDKHVFGAGAETIINATQTDGTPAIDIGRQGTFTTTDAGDLVNATAHNLQEGWPVKFYEFDAGDPSGQTPPGGIAQGDTYYVRNPNANDFQISTTPTGSIFDVTAAAGSGDDRRFWMNGSYTKLANLKIEGDSQTQNAIGLRTESSSRIAIEDVRVNLFDDGVQLGYTGTDIPVWGSWLLDIRNLFITNCGNNCLRAANVNGSRVNCIIENVNGTTTGSYLHLTDCDGSHFNIHAEGAFQTVTSKIDDCDALSLDGCWFEYTNGTNASRTIPFLTIGGTTQCTNLTMDGIKFYGGNDLEVGMLFDRLDGLDGSGTVSCGANGNAVKYTANAFNIRDNFVDSAGVGAWQHRYATPVELTRLPLYNYWPDPFFDNGLPYIPPADQVQVSTLALDTTTVLPGRAQSIKVTANTGVNACRAIFRFPLSGRTADLKGRDVTVGIWWYCPSTYYDVDANPNRFPFVRLVSNGTTPSNSLNYTAIQYIPDTWSLACFESADGSGNSLVIPSDATEIYADVYLQNTGTPQTGMGQHIFIGGIVFIPGTQEILERIRHGDFVNIEEQKSNLLATTTPTVNDDERERYGLGSMWFNSTTEHFFMLVDPVNGTWKQITA
jgi:hypothetical protein